MNINRRGAEAQRGIDDNARVSAVTTDG